MPIANLTKEVTLADSDFLYLPVGHAISNNGYWYTYWPSDNTNNASLTGNSVRLFEWADSISIASADRLSGTTRMEIDGSIAFIDDSAANTSLRYHGGVIEYIGTGTNDITSVSENDAFFFAHLGTFGDNGPTTGGLLEDDAFYWDRAYERNAGDDWEYYQYHKHLPSNYAKFDDGRLIFNGDGYIVPEDKQFGYMITIRATSGPNSYNVPLARIHTPSIGGAHNSHNDVTLPNTSGVNFLPGGILKGSSNRFHAWYLSEGTGANIGKWNVYNRTYTASSGSFNPEVSYGAFDIANAVFAPYPNGDPDNEGTMSGYGLRASAGHTFGSKIYIPVVMKAVARTYEYTVDNYAGNLYYVYGNDRDGPDGTSGSPVNHKTSGLTIKVGDTLSIDNSLDPTVHPLYFRTNTSLVASDNAPGTYTGTGTSNVRTYTPSAAGTYYYVCSVHTGMYGIITVEELDGTYDQQIWSLTDANSLSPGTLLRVDLPYQFQGTDAKPDTLITSVGSNMYIAASGGRGGGAQLFTTTGFDSTGDITLVDDIVTNTAATANQLRLHGFKYNANTTKFFSLLSGTAGSGTYTGKGVYSFDLAGGAFEGYEHLAYDSATGAFKIKPALSTNYLKYDHPTGVITHVPSLEPEGIPTQTSILQWDLASPEFFNKKEINTGNNEYFYQGIYLADGRKALVGRVEGHPENTGENNGDLLLTIVDNENNAVSYTWGGTGDDYITGIIEDTVNDRLVFSGYAKGELSPKGKQAVHGWARNLHQSNDSAAYEFTSIVRDNDGGFILCGNDRLLNQPTIARYDENYNLTKSYYVSIGPDSSEFNTITMLEDGSYIASGFTNYQTSNPFGTSIIAKFNSNDEVVWSKYYGNKTSTGISSKIVTHNIIKSGGVEYIVGYNNIYSGALVTGYGGGELFVMDPSDGSVIKQRSLTHLFYDYDAAYSYIKKIKPGRPNTGEFFALGHITKNAGQYIAPTWAFGNVSTTDLIDFQTYAPGGPGGPGNPLSNAYWTPISDAYSGLTVEKVQSGFNDAFLTNYDSATGEYKVVLVGKTEDITANVDSIADTSEISFAMAQCYTFKDSGGGHLITNNWKKTYTSQWGSLQEIYCGELEDSDQRDWWWNEPEFFHNGNKRIILAGRGINLDDNAAGNDYVADIYAGVDTFFMSINDSDGSVNWENAFGHLGTDYINKSIVWDKYSKNLVAAGHSTSHSVGQDGVLMRFWKDGFGQGVYHTAASTSNAYYLDSISVSPINQTTDDEMGNANGTVMEYPALNTVITDYTSNIAMSVIPQSLVSTEYNGSYGANGLFTAFLAYVDKADLQEFKNTDQYIAETRAGKNIHRAENLFNVFQISTVGDATADDGNIFGYDVIKSSDGEYYYICGQVSGSVAKLNTGLSGVYDYFIGQFNIATEEWRFWQNGTALDEEVYGMTELTGSAAPGHIAVAGRSTGDLGTHTNIGGYDLFLGIFDPHTWTAEYYQQGSGYNDKAMNIHDLQPVGVDNTLALVYNTFGSVNGGPSYGSEDVGVITFDYSTDSWSQGFSIGTETSEEIEQNGKPSTLLPDGRIVVVCNTSGAFADDANTYGLKDMGLGIFTLDSDGSGTKTGSWKRYQVGSGSSDFSYSVANNGSTVLLTGYSEATWDKEVHGVMVEFDPEINILGKNAGT